MALGWNLQLTLKSLWNRRGTAALTVAAIAVSVALLLAVQNLRVSARESFASTVSGVDLVVGARSGPINLLLYSVFRVGDATANVSWESYQKIAGHRDVEWTIPISLGDSHRGFRVLGTTADFFRFYRYGEQRPLAFIAGVPFSDLYDAVIGAEVAEALGYRTGDAIVIAHGLGQVSFAQHGDKPFRISGVLARTGTPVDRTVHVSLEALTAIHIDWQSGIQAPEGARISAQEARAHELTPESITAFMVGMRSKAMTFQMQRAINDYRREPLLAILPGVVLSQLWELVGIADKALMLVAAFVVVAGLLCMLATILTSMRERRREMAILRAVGARPRDVFLQFLAEAAILSISGVLGGIALLYALMAAVSGYLGHRFGIFVSMGLPAGSDLAILGGIIVSALIVGLIPAWRGYRNTLADGLQVRV